MGDEKQRVFVVTGGNRGIGNAVVRGIAKRAIDGVVYLTSRDARAGEEAVNAIKLDLASDLKADVRWTKLDIRDPESVQELATLLKTEHGGLDVLVNNAGIACSEEEEDEDESEEAMARRRVEQAEMVLDVNYYGTKRVCDTLVPIIRPGGRIINVTGKYKSELTADLLSPQVTIEAIDNFVEDFKKLVREEASGGDGFTFTAYRISKAAELALTKALVRDLRPKQIKVNACCPGFCATRLSGWEGPLDPSEGADTLVYLAVDADAPDGRFVFERKIIFW
uniref:Carbonyl reductase [NADPH] 1 n=1 Tax=Steinernema glaseri TaxID=37863 RepID=A0A1I7ZZD6_9BILA